MEPQWFFGIYLEDVVGSGLLDNAIPSQTGYNIFLWLPHACYLQNQGLQGHYFKHNLGTSKVFLHSSYRYFMFWFLDNAIPSQAFMLNLYDFLIHVTS